MTIFFKISGMAEAIGTIKELPPKLERGVILRMSQRTFDEGVRGAGRHNKTGRLVASLFNRAIPHGQEVGHDLQRAPHALFVHFSTKPHVIVPKSKKALRWSAGGKFSFAKRVNHPGYRGDPYLYNAADAAVRQFSAIVDAAFNEATR